MSLPAAAAVASSVAVDRLRSRMNAQYCLEYPFMISLQPFAVSMTSYGLLCSTLIIEPPPAVISSLLAAAEEQEEESRCSLNGFVS